MQSFLHSNNIYICIKNQKFNDLKEYDLKLYRVSERFMVSSRLFRSAITYSVLPQFLRTLSSLN